jgi:ubiquinone biosynthesis accessory factor UbiK
MFKPPFFEEISQSLLSLFPTSLQQTEQDLKRGIKDILTQAFSHLDLVNREEFDVQTKVLARTREKLEALEERLNAQSAREEV